MKLVHIYGSHASGKTTTIGKILNQLQDDGATILNVKSNGELIHFGHQGDDETSVILKTKNGQIVVLYSPGDTLEMIQTGMKETGHLLTNTDGENLLGYSNSIDHIDVLIVTSRNTPSDGSKYYKDYSESDLFKDLGVLTPVSDTEYYPFKSEALPISKDITDSNSEFGLIKNDWATYILKTIGLLERSNN